MADLRQVSRQTVHLAVLVAPTSCTWRSSAAGTRRGCRPRWVAGCPPMPPASARRCWRSRRPSVVQAVIDRGLPAVGPRTITAPGLLLRELRRIRELRHRLRERGIRARRRLRGQPGAAPYDPGRADRARSSVSGWSGTLDLRRVRPGGADRGAGGRPRDSTRRGPLAVPPQRAEVPRIDWHPRAVTLRPGRQARRQPRKAVTSIMNRAFSPFRPNSATGSPIGPADDRRTAPTTPR